MSGLAIVGIVNASNRRRRVLAAEARVFDQGDHSNFWFVRGCVCDKPGVVLVLTAIFAKTDDLRRSSLASYVETGHSYTCTGASCIYYAPHSFHDCMLPCGSVIGRPAPIAAAIASSTK